MKAIILSAMIVFSSSAYAGIEELEKCTEFAQEGYAQKLVCSLQRQAVETSNTRDHHKLAAECLSDAVTFCANQYKSAADQLDQFEISVQAASGGTDAKLFCGIQQKNVDEAKLPSTRRKALQERSACISDTGILFQQKLY